MLMRTLGCGGIAVMNDDTADLITPIMSVANRKSDFGPVQIEVNDALVSRHSHITSL